MWSKEYSCCTECGTTERKHYGKGLCYRCYNRRKRKENPVPNRERAKRYYYNNTDRCKKRISNQYYQNKEESLRIRKIYRNMVNFNGMRDYILDRDDGTCQRCGSNGYIVHHIDGTGHNSEVHNNDESNLITLCRSCHCIVHKPRLGTGKE